MMTRYPNLKITSVLIQCSTNYYQKNAYKAKSDPHAQYVVPKERKMEWTQQ